jgi:hypothetical protein
MLRPYLGKIDDPQGGLACPALFLSQWRPEFIPALSGGRHLLSSLRYLFFPYLLNSLLLLFIIFNPPYITGPSSTGTGPHRRANGSLPASATTLIASGAMMT